MKNGLVVKTNKNVFLLYAMLDALELMRGSKESHPLRKRTYKHFKDYEGTDLSIHDYGHHSKAVIYALTIEDAPSFKNKYKPEQIKNLEFEIKYGKSVKKHLIHFYKSTDFEDYYTSVLSEYRIICQNLKKLVTEKNINKILNEVWKTEGKFNMVVIPMPLEARRSGIGPSVGNTSYQIIGPPFDKYVLENLIHEGSHPRAKIVLKKFKKEIDNINYLFKLAKNHQNWPKNYGTWGTCFEEHVIRAFQLVFINPKIGFSEYEKRLEFQINNKGMVFLKDICKVLKSHEYSKYNIDEVISEVINHLKKRYD